MSDSLPRSIPGGPLSASGPLPSVTPSSLGGVPRSAISSSNSGPRQPLFLRLETPFPALWVGFLLFVLWTLTVLAVSARTGTASPIPDLPVEDVLERLATRKLSWGPATPIRADSLPALLGFGSSILLGWVWLLTAGLAYVVRPDGIAARAFMRWAAMLATLLIAVSDFHTSQRLVPIYFVAFALSQSALLEFVLSCYHRR